MKKRSISLIIFLCLGFHQIKAQYPKEVTLDVRVNCLDSQYVMVPSLKILKKNLVIQIPGEILYTNEFDQSGGCRFFLQRLISNHYVNIYISGFNLPLLNQDYHTLKDFRFGDCLKDTINLQQFVPIEIGKYRLCIELDYYLESKKHKILSNWIEFNVDFKPKGSIFE